MKAALLILALAAAGGNHRPPPAAPCVAANVPFVARALPRILALADPPPATLEAGFVLCSTHEDRLLAAAAALGKSGYSSYLGAAETEKCLRVPSKHEATAAAMEQEMTGLCWIAASYRIDYRHWQTEVAGKSVRLAGDRLTIDGKARRP